jgi:hypothetical protein
MRHTDEAKWTYLFLTTHLITTEVMMIAVVLTAVGVQDRQTGVSACSFCPVKTEREVKLPLLSEEWLEVLGAKSVASGTVRRNTEMLFIVRECSSHSQH